jgi:sodium/potassium-transporting ATPase subunit alpha
MNSIMNLLPSDALVTRGGQSTKMPSSDLVVGDVVKISIGNKTPADMRILSTSGVSIAADQLPNYFANRHSPGPAI